MSKFNSSNTVSNHKYVRIGTNNLKSQKRNLIDISKIYVYSSMTDRPTAL